MNSVEAGSVIAYLEAELSCINMFFGFQGWLGMQLSPLHVLSSPIRRLLVHLNGA